MKKFEFSLNRMLNYKDQVLREEKNTLMQLRTQKIAIDKKIEKLIVKLQEVNAKFREEINEGVSSEKIQAFKFHIENIRNQLTQLNIEQKFVSNAIEKQLKMVVSTSQDVSSLDKLKEKQREEYDYSSMKTDELSISEFVSLQQISNKREF